MGEIRKVEELVLEIPVEKYNLQDLNIKLRLGSHQEKSSTYESDSQTLHYEVEEDVADEDADALVEEREEPEISMTSMNNDIVLEIPSEKYSLNDLNLSIKFTQYGEASSTYEVKKEDKKAEPVDSTREPGPENA
jgi:nitrate reductase alpha subunit